MSTPPSAPSVLARIAEAIARRDFGVADTLFGAVPSEQRWRPEARRLAGQLAWARGDYPQALLHFEAACRQHDSPDDQLALARARVGVGAVDAAIEQLDQFVRRTGHQAGLRPMLELLRFDDAAAEAGLAALEASGTPASDPHAYLHWRALRVLAGLERPARLEIDHPRAQAIWEFFLYQLRHRPPARLVGSAPQLLDLALRQAPATGLLLECGVYHGRSLRYLAASTPDAQWHGFDSFEGLPEDWLPGEPAGSYSTGGRLPALPPNVQLHRGWFRDSLPLFLSQQPAEPIRLLHVDCDLYSSTVDVLSALGDRLRPGSVIVFDDYLGFPDAGQHEFRAFAEFCRARRVSYRYLGFALMGREAAAQIERIDG